MKRERILPILGFSLVLLLSFQNCSQVTPSVSTRDLSSVSDGTSQSMGNPSGSSSADPNSSTTAGDSNDSNNSNNSNGTNNTTTNGSGGTSTGTVCMVPPSLVVQPTKIIFAVDMSGSNANSSVVAGGTDPNKTFRAGSITKFLDTYAQKQNFQWQFTTFAGSSAIAYITDPMTRKPVFAADSGKMYDALTRFKSTADDGLTPYKRSLDLLRSIISSGISSGDNTSNYAILFMSDGVPTDYCTDPDNCSAGDAQLLSDVKSLVGLAPGRIALSTIYYGPIDSKAAARLKNMAIAGQGQSADTNVSGSQVTVEDVITIPGGTCPK